MEITCSNLSEQKLQYSLKYDRQMLMTVERDVDVRMVFKENEEHGYLYVGENDRPTRQGHKDGAACEGRTHSCLCVMGGELEDGGDGGVTYELMHPMETHNMGIVDAKTGRVVGGDDLDDDYDRCILPPTNGRQPGRPPSKRRELQTQGIKSQRCSKCSEVGHTRRTYRNLRVDFDANYEGDVVEVEDLLDVIKAHELAIQSSSQFIDKYFPATWKWFRHRSKLWCTLCNNLVCLPGSMQMFTVVNHGLQPVNPWETDRLQPWNFGILLILASELSPYPHPCLYFNMQHNFACSAQLGKLVCLPGMRQMFTVVNHSLQLVNPWGIDRLQPWHFGFLLILASELSPHPHPYLYFNVQVHWCMCMEGW
ncbi:hypothetical protein Cgig2_026806 [Carnegiea gigantea]|uniref:Uncharacterized protein n=1 Tax=Carnegiea gigantea TaxID=171969 RepID=A0A9Q1GLJ8_9CARY|nr:hypothetical protein Cgig2_026806 [Carnegiea gigantea]